MTGIRIKAEKTSEGGKNTKETGVLTKLFFFCFLSRQKRSGGVGGAETKMLLKIIMIIIVITQAKDWETKIRGSTFSFAFNLVA